MGPTRRPKALDEFGPDRVMTLRSRLGFSAIAVGAAMNGLRPIVEFMTSTAVLAATVTTRQQDAADERWPFGCPIAFRGPNGRPVSSPPPQSAYRAFTPDAGAEGRDPVHANDAKGLLKSAIRDEIRSSSWSRRRCTATRARFPRGSTWFRLARRTSAVRVPTARSSASARS